MNDEMKAVQARMIANYRTMLADIDDLIAANEHWQASHPGEQPVDVEVLRVNRRGAELALAAVECGAAIPDEAMRMLKAG